MTQTQTPFDQIKSDKFVEKLMGQLNGAALSLMVSIAHRTGLFDKMADMKASTSKEIAEAAGLNERYVREALGAFVTGGMVEYDEEHKTYFLPAEHAAWLTRKNVPNNVASTMQWISVLGGVEDAIVECFKKGGGLKYEQYHRFHEVMAEESFQTSVHPILDHIIPLAPGMKEKLKQGIEVMDLGCGSGSALTRLAEAYPNSRFTGYDFSEEAVEIGQKNAEAKGVKNIRFIALDVAKITDKEKYDLILTFDAIHDQATPDKVLKNIYEALKPGGTYLMQDIAGSSHVHKNHEHPIAPFLYTISCMHCMSVSLEQEGAGLGAMWGKEVACEMLKKAGFKKVDVKQLDHDMINYYYLTQK